MQIKNKKLYYLKRQTVIEGLEADKYSDYGSPIPIEANIYPAEGRLQAQIYGQRLNYILNMLYDGDTEILEGDGICVNVPETSKPDYKVISIKSYSHKLIELEKI